MSARSGDRDEESDPTAKGNSRTTKWLQPSAKVTPHQAFYIFGIHGIGAMIVAGVVNLAIVYGGFLVSDDDEDLIGIIESPVPSAALIAGVTISLQSIFTWLAAYKLVSCDLGRRKVQPIGFVNEPRGKCLRWFFILSPNKNDKIENVRVTSLKRAGQHLTRAFLLAVLGFVLLWPVSVGALMAVRTKAHKNGGSGAIWAPKVLKTVVGALFALLTTPLMAIFWLLRGGWEANQYL